MPSGARHAGNAATRVIRTIRIGERPRAWNSCSAATSAGVQKVPVAVNMIEHERDRPEQGAGGVAKPQPDSAVAQQAPEQFVLEAPAQADERAAGAEAKLGETGLLECATQPLAREVGAVARQLKREPAVAEAPPLPGAPVGQGDDQTASGSQELECQPQVAAWVENVFQAMLEDDQVVALRL